MRILAFALLIVMLLSVGLLGTVAARQDDPSTPSPEPEPVILQFIGNSCILITAPDGTRVVSDPYGKFSRPDGLDKLPTDLTADVVTVSHEHTDHNNIRAVGGEPLVLDGPGTTEIGMVTVTGYPGFEGSPAGPSDLPNTIFVFEIAGVKIVHLGDSGIVTDPDVLAEIENADVILVNIDGYVIPQDAIISFLQDTHARTILLTHYSLNDKRRWYGAPTAGEFLDTLPADVEGVQIEGSELLVTPEMPAQVVALTPLALSADD